MKNLDKIAELIEDKLAYTNGWRIDETTYTEHCYEVAENVVKLFAIPDVTQQSEQFFALLRYTMPEQFTDIALKNIVKGFIEQSK